MKNLIYKTLGVMLLVPALLACGGNSSQKEEKVAGVKFAPREKQSSLTDAERQERIAQKVQSLAQFSPDSLIQMRGVKFSILPPSASKDLPLEASDKLCNSLIQIAAANGISGLCTNPVLALVSRVNRSESAMTNNISQKAVVKYEVTLYCGNTITGDIYASCTQALTGVGANFDIAAGKAFDEFENTNQINTMFATASERAIEWYSVQANVENLVTKAVAEENYPLAMALLNSVPEQAAETYAYAQEYYPQVVGLLFEEQSAKLFADLKDLVAKGDTAYLSDAGVILKMISPRSAVYPEALKVYDSYVSRVHSFEEQKRAQIRENEMYAREKESHERKLAHELALAEVELRKVVAPIEAKAAIEEMKINASAKKSTAWSEALSSSAASIGYGMRGGLFGENGMFGKGGLLGIGSFAEPISKAVDGLSAHFNKEED